MTRMLAVTIDIEPDLPNYVKGGEVGVNQGLPRLLETLQRTHVTADYYLTASLLPRLRGRLGEIRERGFSIGLHGLTHTLLAGKHYQVQLAEVKLGLELLRKHLGVHATTFRAPAFGADETTFRALRTVGIQTDSSTLPGRTVKKHWLRTVADHRGLRPDPYEVQSERPEGAIFLLEVPLSENPFARGRPLGMGYLNTFGASKTLEAASHCPSNLVTFLIHPWECIDLTSHYPKIPKAWETGCRSDLSELGDFLTRASREFEFTTIAEYGSAYRRARSGAA